jgi:hypothetical protein
MFGEASALLKKAQLARQQATRARRLSNGTSAPDVAAQLRKYADELEQRAIALEERAAAVVLPKATTAPQRKTPKTGQLQRPTKPSR